MSLTADQKKAIIDTIQLFAPNHNCEWVEEYQRSYDSINNIDLCVEITQCQQQGTPETLTGDISVLVEEEPTTVFVQTSATRYLLDLELTVTSYATTYAKMAYEIAHAIKIGMASESARQTLLAQNIATADFGRLMKRKKEVSEGIEVSVWAVSWQLNTVYYEYPTSANAIDYFTQNDALIGEGDLVNGD